MSERLYPGQAAPSVKLAVVESTLAPIPASVEMARSLDVVATCLDVVATCLAEDCIGEVPTIRAANSVIMDDGTAHWTGVPCSECERTYTIEADPEGW